MSGVAQGVAGAALVLAAWAVPRRVAGARRLGIATLLDAAPLAAVALVLLAATGRPIFAGALTFALGAGFAFADRIVRETLREPVVFSALSELPQIVTHPHLYLPFAGTGRVLAGAAAAVLAAMGLLLAEPAIATPQPLAALAVAGLVAVLLWRTGREPWLGGAARALRRLQPTGEPVGDAARLGPAAMLIVHGVVARAERRARQARLAPRPGRAPRDAAARPVILVQCESFFDARRALPTLPPAFLAGYDAACAGATHGWLEVPAWGANTTRAEFAVLTGLDEAALGYDRFNPYHALAQAPIASQVRRLREAGYRTICLHPFDRRFFRRDLAMPALGFDAFLGCETLGGSRTPPYAGDPQLAEHILRIFDSMGRRVLIFAITMGNHGPWNSNRPVNCPPLDAALAGCVDDDMPQRGEMLRYLDGLRQSDDMLSRLIDGLAQRRSDAVLGFYGDHLPSLPRAFAHLRFDDWRTDYAIWSAAGIEPCRRDLTAHELGRAVVDAALAPRNRTPFDAVVAERHDA